MMSVQHQHQHQLNQIRYKHLGDFSVRNEIKLLCTAIKDEYVRLAMW